MLLCFPLLVYGCFVDRESQVKNVFVSRHLFMYNILHAYIPACFLSSQQYYCNQHHFYDSNYCHDKRVHPPFLGDQTVHYLEVPSSALSDPTEAVDVTVVYYNVGTFIRHVARLWSFEAVS